MVSLRKIPMQRLLKQNKLYLAFHKSAATTTISGSTPNPPPPPRPIPAGPSKGHKPTSGGTTSACLPPHPVHPIPHTYQPPITPGLCKYNQVLFKCYIRQPTGKLLYVTWYYGTLQFCRHFIWIFFHAKWLYCLNEIRLIRNFREG